MSRTGRRRPGRAQAASHAAARKLHVFTEGEKTEVQYLGRWSQSHRERVLVVFGHFHGSPRRLVEEARKQKREDRRRDQLADEYWCVFDIDEHRRVPEAIDMAQANQIRLAVSNPCIELWFLLHFEDQNAYIDRSAAQSESKRRLQCGKNLSSEALARLEARFEDARRRAQNLDRKHELDGSPPRTNPSSNIWELVERIRAE
ncbi:MAG: RloB family protein [bacterium]|nr:RloB family protein [bacterium]